MPLAAFFPILSIHGTAYSLAFYAKTESESVKKRRFYCILFSKVYKL